MFEQLLHVLLSFKSQTYLQIQLIYPPSEHTEATEFVIAVSRADWKLLGWLTSNIWAQEWVSTAKDFDMEDATVVAIGLAEEEASAHPLPWPAQQ